MTKDEVLKMARESGWGQAKPHDDCISCGVFDLEAFAELVRADEREACALLCDEAAIKLVSNGKARVSQVDRHTAEVLRYKAEAIRARGNT